MPDLAHVRGGWVESTMCLVAGQLGVRARKDLKRSTNAWLERQDVMPNRQLC